MIYICDNKNKKGYHMINRRLSFLSLTGLTLGLTGCLKKEQQTKSEEKKETKITEKPAPEIIVSKNEIPIRFFLNNNDGIPPLRVKRLVDKHGKNILIGIDPGAGDTPDDGSALTVKAVKSVGAKLHVYLVGPGMWSWSQGEQDQIANFAKSVGIDTNKSGWKQEWYSSGWKKKNIQQFEYYYTNHNAYSCEIDNIDSATIQNDPDKTVEYYGYLQKQLKDKNIKTKLMIKNLDEDQLNAVIAAKFNTNFLCEYGMFEAGTGDPRKQIQLCEKIGIKAITPINGITDTNNYGVIAEGIPYDLKK